MTKEVRRALRRVPVSVAANRPPPVLVITRLDRVIQRLTGLLMRAEHEAGRG
jgi:hypothetical protein